MSASSEPVEGRVSGRTVILVVTGGIAAYKACELVRRLRDHGASVRVAMTRAATRFVGPTTFAALSGHRVIDDMWADASPEEIAHVRWAEAADLVVVAPATADFLARMALGIASDFASTLCLAATCPVLVAPAMEDDMYRHPAVQRNLATLQRDGVETVGPESGFLASGRRGPGRMSEPGTIVASVLRLLEDGARPRWLTGKRVLVSSGPTHQAIDPVRYLGNRSSGRMGHALAQEASRLGAGVTLVTGPTCLEPPPDVEVVRVTDAAAMAAAVHARAASEDFIVMAAAVADYTPVEVAAEKLKKGLGDELVIRLGRTEDILERLGHMPEPRPLLVGFAAESEDLEARAQGKLQRKNCDLVVANEIGDGAVGMGAARNRVVTIDRGGERAEFGPAPKSRVATFIWDRVRRLAEERER